MKTNFFSQLASQFEGYDLHLVIKPKDENLNVMARPVLRVNDPAKEQMKPINFVGTAEEIDEAFFNEFEKVTPNLKKLAIDLNQYEEDQAAFEAKTKKAKSLEKEQAKEKTAALSKYAKDLKKAQELAAKKQWRKAYGILNPYKSEKANNAGFKTLWQKVKEGTFGKETTIFDEHAEHNPAPVPDKTEQEVKS